MTPLSEDGKRTLTDATDTLSNRVDGLSRQLRISQRQTTILKGLVALFSLLAVAAFVGGWVIYNQQQDIQTSREQQCENGNATRLGQQASWRELLTVSTASLEASSAAEGVKPPKAVLDYYQAYIRWVEEDLFPLRDCENLDKVYPKPGPPPSFEKALKASLKQDQRDGGGQ